MRPRTEHISVIAANLDDDVIARIGRIIEHNKVRVDGRGDLEAYLSEQLRSSKRGGQRTLDLIGHCEPGQPLQVGGWSVDPDRASVRAFFRGLVDHDVFVELGITSLRLLGCSTAITDHGRRAITTLASICNLDVFGTSEMTYDAHYDSAGFRVECEHLLIAATTQTAQIGAVPYRRNFDVEALPLSMPRPGDVVLDRVRSQQLLQQIRRGDGAWMLDAPPVIATVAIPATDDRVHLIEILVGGEFVRVFPDGIGRPAIVFPTKDPAVVLRIVGC